MQDDLTLGGLIKYVVVGLLALIIVFGSFTIVRAGERGVKVRLGNVVGVLESGLHLKVPVLDDVVKVDVRTKTVLYEREEPLTAASKDLQDVAIATVVNYKIQTADVANVYIQYRSVESYEADVIRPGIRDVVKATASNFTAEELVTKRAEFTESVTAALNERLNSKFSTVEQVNITDLQFSQSFTAAIEAKVTAEQEALAAKNRLEQIKFEAEQLVVKAEAEAESIRIQAQAITQQGGKDYVQLKAIEKWNGSVPHMMIPGASVPFININQ